MGERHDAGLVDGSEDGGNEIQQPSASRKKKKLTINDGTSEDDAWMKGREANESSEGESSATDRNTSEDVSEDEAAQPRKKKQKGPSTADLCAELLRINAANMKLLLDAHKVTDVAMAVTGTSASINLPITGTGSGSGGK
jgi:predicted HTH transcriptional regulator